jgi:hypothetical protein
MSPDPGETFPDDAYTTAAYRRPGWPEQLPAGTSTAADRARIETDLATVRTELGRMDGKTNALLTVCGLLLGAAVTVLSQADLPVAAAVDGWIGVALAAAALQRLLFAVLPNLRGHFGFIRWAAAGSGQGVLDALASDQDGADPGLARASELHQLSKLLRGKYRAIRHASLLLIASVDAGAVTAVLAVWSPTTTGGTW